MITCGTERHDGELGRVEVAESIRHGFGNLVKYALPQGAGNTEGELTTTDKRLSAMAACNLSHVVHSPGVASPIDPVMQLFLKLLF